MKCGVLSSTCDMDDWGFAELASAAAGFTLGITVTEATCVAELEEGGKEPQPLRKKLGCQMVEICEGNVLEGHMVV